MKRRAFLHRMACALVGVGMFGDALLRRVPAIASEREVVAYILPTGTFGVTNMVVPESVGVRMLADGRASEIVDMDGTWGLMAGPRP